MIKRGLTLVAAMHITASVFINDDESGLHHDYEVWLEKLAPHAPIDQYWHNRMGEDACPSRTGCRRAPQAAWGAKRSRGGRGDQRPTRRLHLAFDRAHAEGSPKSLARGSGSWGSAGWLTRES